MNESHTHLIHPSDLSPCRTAIPPSGVAEGKMRSRAAAAPDQYQRDLAEFFSPPAGVSISVSYSILNDIVKERASLVIHAHLSHTISSGSHYGLIYWLLIIDRHAIVVFRMKFFAFIFIFYSVQSTELLCCRARNKRLIT